MISEEEVRRFTSNLEVSLLDVLRGGDIGVTLECYYERSELFFKIHLSSVRPANSKEKQ